MFRWLGVFLCVLVLGAALADTGAACPVGVFGHVYYQGSTRPVPDYPVELYRATGFGQPVYMGRATTRSDGYWSFALCGEFPAGQDGIIVIAEVGTFSETSVWVEENGGYVEMQNLWVPKDFPHPDPNDPGLPNP